MNFWNNIGLFWVCHALQSSICQVISMVEYLFCVDKVHWLCQQLWRLAALYSAFLRRIFIGAPTPPRGETEETICQKSKPEQNKNKWNRMYSSWQLLSTLLRNFVMIATKRWSLFVRLFVFVCVPVCVKCQKNMFPLI